MLKAHGIESVMESVTNSTNKKRSPFHRFEHSVKLKEIFSFYDTSIIKVKPDQGYAIRRVLGEGSNSTRVRIAEHIALHGLRLIIDAVVNREFIFKMPFKNLDVKIKIKHGTKRQDIALFKFHRGKIDPFEVGFQMFHMVFQVDYPNRPRCFFNINLSKDMYERMMDNKRKGLTYENSKIRDLNHVVDMLEDEYPHVLKSSIRSALRHLLNTIFKALIRRVDTYINLDHTNDKFFVYFSGSSDVTQYVKLRRKARFLAVARRIKPKHDGMYYFSLTDDNMAYYNQPVTVRASCTRFIEELMACKSYAKNIFQIELKDNKEYSLFYDIHKNYDNTKYIYRWDDNGFKPINNT